MQDEGTEASDELAMLQSMFHGDELVFEPAKAGSGGLGSYRLSLRPRTEAQEKSKVGVKLTCGGKGAPAHTVCCTTLLWCSSDAGASLPARRPSSGLP